MMVEFNTGNRGPVQNEPRSSQNANKPSGFLGHAVDTVAKGFDLLVRTANEFFAEASGQPIIGTSNLLDRTIDLPGYLEGLDFESLKEVATSVLEELEAATSDKERMLKAVRVFGDLSSMNLEHLDEDQKNEFAALLAKAPLGLVMKAAEETALPILGGEADASTGHLDQVLKSVRHVCLFSDNFDIGNRAYTLLGNVAKNEAMPPELRLYTAYTLLTCSNGSQVKGEAARIYLEVSGLGNVPLEKLVEEVGNLLYYTDTTEVAEEAAKVLLEIAQKDPSLVPSIVEKASSALAHTENYETAYGLLLNLSKLDHAPVGDIAKSAGSVLFNGEGVRVAYVSQLLFELATEHESSRTAVAEIVGYTLRSDSDQKRGVANLLLGEISKIDEMFFDAIVEQSKDILKSDDCSRNTVKQEMSLLVDLAQKQGAPVGTILNTIYDIALFSFDPNSSSIALDALRQFSELECLFLDEKINALLKSYIAVGEGKLDLKESILDQLGGLLLTEGLNFEEINLSIDVLENFLSRIKNEDVKSKVLTFFVENVLQNNDFAQEPERLRKVSNMIIDELEGLEEDERYQAAQAVLLNLNDPNEEDNPYAIHTAAIAKREALNELDSQSLEAVIPATSNGAYKLSGSYIGMVMPTPDPEDMPKTSYEDLLDLQVHLREAVMHASVETKQTLLQTDESDEAKLNEAIENMLETFDRVINSQLLRGWMKPQSGNGFNRTKYELQSVIASLHKELEIWNSDGVAHGGDLSNPAAVMYQLMVNITTCPSGKRAGVRLSAQQAGVPLPKSDEVLVGQTSEALQNFLASNEEGALTARDFVMDFITEAYDAYMDLRSNLLDGDSDFIQTMTNQDRVSQPSHQHDYAYNVLGQALGLMVEGEIVPVDLYGGVINKNLRNASGEELLDGALSQTIHGDNVSDAVVNLFAKQLWDFVKEGVQPSPSKEADKRYKDFSKLIDAMGLSLSDVFDYEEDDDFNMTFVGLKPEAVQKMLEHLGILKRA